jgi:hypothetical protein
LFGFEAYHILLAALGLSIILSFWLPRFVSGREPATSALLILGGLITFSFIPGMPEGDRTGRASAPVGAARRAVRHRRACSAPGCGSTGLRAASNGCRRCACC